MRLLSRSKQWTLAGGVPLGEGVQQRIGQVGQGGGGVEVAVKAARGQTVTKETWIPFKLVTPENLSQFKKC